MRGGMYWKSQSGRDYLIRTSVNNTQKSLGVRSEQTEETYRRFIDRKSATEERLGQLQKTMLKHQRLNRALFVGRTPQIVIELLNQSTKDDIAEHFIVIGTHALYAYESASGVRISETDALATRDVDLLWDTRKRLSFGASMELHKSSMLQILRKVDKSFSVRPDQLFTVVNNEGFEVDFIRREAKGRDPRPLKLTNNEDEVRATEAKRAEALLSAPKFSAMVVSASGHMARMNTVAPTSFASFKLWMAEQKNPRPFKAKSGFDASKNC